MNHRNITNWLQQLLVPGLLIFVGLGLLVRPDAAPRLISTVLGWLLMGVGMLYAISAIVGSRERGETGPAIVRNGTVAAVCILAGAFLVARPLFLAAIIGCIVGAVLLLRGVQQMRSAAQREGSILTVVAGIILILLPMTTSRIVFRGCGVVMVLFGCLMLWGNLRGSRPDAGNDSNIIDI